MLAVNLSATPWTQRFKDRVGRLIPQARVIWARAFTSRDFAAFRAKVRALFSWMERALEFVEREIMERLYARRMAVRRIFLRDPKNPNGGYTRDGLTLLTHLARHTGVLSAELQNDPIALARAEGKREIMGLLWTEIFEDLPDFARVMANEERKRAEEIVPA